jgi:hypothetical protein
MSYWSTDAGWRTASNAQFERLGLPGQYHSAMHWTGGQMDFTGSKYGAAAFLISGSGHSGNINVAGGVAISISEFETNRILPIGISQISGSTGIGGIYVFKRQQ